MPILLTSKAETGWIFHCRRRIHSRFTRLAMMMIRFFRFCTHQWLRESYFDNCLTLFCL
jgi:hypothetical protein